MLCEFLLYSKVILLYIYIHFFQILFHYGLLQVTEYSSLCYIVGPCCLSILCNSLHLLNPNSQSLPSPAPLPLGNHKSVFYVCESVSVSVS